MSNISSATASQPVQDWPLQPEANSGQVPQATRLAQAGPALQGPIVPMDPMGYRLNDLVSTPKGKLMFAGMDANGCLKLRSQTNYYTLPADARSRAQVDAWARRQVAQGGITTPLYGVPKSAPKKPAPLSAQSIEAARAKWDQQSAGHAESTKLKWEARAAYGVLLLRNQDKGQANAPLKVSIQQIQWMSSYGDQKTRDIQTQTIKADAAHGRITLFAHSYGATKSALLELARLSGRPLGNVVIGTHGTEGVGPGGVKFFNPNGKVLSSHSGQRYDGYQFPDIARDFAQLGIIGKGSTLVSESCNTVREAAGQAGFQSAADTTGATLVGTTDVIGIWSKYTHSEAPFKVFTPRTR